MHPVSSGVFAIYEINPYIAILHMYIAHCFALWWGRWIFRLDLWWVHWIFVSLDLWVNLVTHKGNLLGLYIYICIPKVNWMTCSVASSPSCTPLNLIHVLSSINFKATVKLEYTLWILTKAQKEQNQMTATNNNYSDYFKNLSITTKLL